MNQDSIADYKQRIRLFMDTSKDLKDTEAHTVIKLIDLLIDYELTQHPNWTRGQAGLGILNDIHPEVYQAALVDIRNEMMNSLAGDLDDEVIGYFLDNRNPSIAFQKALYDWSQLPALEKHSTLMVLSRPSSADQSNVSLAIRLLQLASESNSK